MRIYDRILPNRKPLTTISQLPLNLELGRYYDAESGLDLTNRTILLDSSRRIHQDLIEEKQESTMKLFYQFYDSMNRNQENIVPLIQDVTDKLRLNSFENKLLNELWHIEYICRQPHFLLNREIEKVNVARAKRISTRTYGYLSSHTEDWLQKSVVTFKPRKVLNEELDEFYDVYENHVAVAFVLRTLRYLKARLDEIEHITVLLQDKEYLLQNRHDETGWYKKIERNLELIGNVLSFGEDDKRSGQSLANETREKLTTIQTRLKTLTNSVIFYETSPTLVSGIMSDPIIKPTNVTVNHKHYRYLRDLWTELNKHRKEKSEEEHINYEQQVIQGVRDYVKAGIYYCVKQYLKYDVSGSYNEWSATHKNYLSLSLKETNNKNLSLIVDSDKKYSIVVLANELVGECEVPDNTFVLEYKYSDKQYLKNRKIKGQVIDISPYDPDSVEWIGKLIKSVLVQTMCEKITKEYSFDHMLIDYVPYIGKDFLCWNTSTYTYHYSNFSKPIDVRDILSSIHELDSYNKKNYQIRKEIDKHVIELIEQIHVQNNVLRNLLKCPDCGEFYDEHLNGSEISYLKCYCGFILDLSNGHIILRQCEEKYRHLQEEDWGMDYLYV